MGKGIGVVVASCAEMKVLGRLIAARLSGNAACVTLVGELGAGKTTLVRAILRALGHAGVVRSPTYTLMEEYPLAQLVLHLDLYRLADPEELEYIGLRDALAEQPLIFVEWPERGQGMLPDVDIAIHIDYLHQPAQLAQPHGQSEQPAPLGRADQARRVTLLPVSDSGSRMLEGGGWTIESQP